MTIKIDRDTTICDFNDRFKTLFPYLKVEFFRKGHNKFAPSHSKFMYSDQLEKISNICELSEPVEIELRPDLKTFEFEEIMERKYGMHIQVMRRSGDTYLITSQTDDWTLEEQNNAGFESVRYRHREDEDEKMDYREMD